MSNVKSFLTPAKVVEYFELEVEKLLKENEIFKLSSYAFYFDEYGDEVINPDYAGIAQWQINPPVQIVSASPVRTEINVNPSDEEADLMWLATDAESLLDNARLMLGHMLLIDKATMEPSKVKTFMEKSVHSCISFNPLFWSYYNSAVIHLSMVSDRLREFLITSLESKGIEAFSYNQKDRNGNNPPYVNIFNDVKKLVRPTPALQVVQTREYFDSMKSLAKKIQLYRRNRNDIVHDQGSEQGRLEKSLVSGFQDADAENRLYFSDKKSRSDNTKPNSDIAEKSVSERLNECIDWYESLIKLSDFVYRVEVAFR